jgi:hypothetical protein
MLHAAQAPLSYWAEAANTFVYLRNRMEPSNQKNKSAYEMLFGREPNLNHIRVWGSRCHARRLDHRHKFEPKSNEYRFVGYAKEAKAYRLLDTSNNKIMIRRDVIFHELEILLTMASTIPAQPLQKGPTSEDNNTSDDEQNISVTHEQEHTKTTPPTTPTIATAKIKPRVRQPKVTTVTTVETEIENAAPRRGSRIRNPPTRYRDTLFHNREASKEPDPVTVEEALKSKDAKHWLAAMQKEYNSLRRNNTWNLAKLPINVIPLSVKWVFKKKYKADGTLDKFRARLVARGFEQRYGCDYTETFAPVARLDTIRTLLALATINGWHIRISDVETAYLNGIVQEEIWIEQPFPFINKEYPGHACRLNKAIYGLKQAGAAWNATLDNFLIQSGYQRSPRDYCLYQKQIEKNTIFLLVYVDDLVYISASLDFIHNEHDALHKQFPSTELEEISSLLGMSVYYNREQQIMHMSAPHRVDTILRRHQMHECAPVDNPADPNQLNKLSKKDAPANEQDQQTMKEIPYRGIIGALNYLAHSCRPDISMATNRLARYLANPGIAHWQAAKRVLRYLSKTPMYGITYNSGTMQSLHAFSDSDHAGDPDDRHSTIGYVVMFAGGPVAWRSTKNTRLAHSTLEAEYFAASECLRELKGITHIIKEANEPYANDNVHYHIKEISEIIPDLARIGINAPIIIYEDNAGAIAVAENPKNYSRTKHWELDMFYLRIQISTGAIKLQYCPTGEMIADTLTKALPTAKFEYFRDGMNIRSSEEVRGAPHQA